MLPILVEKLQEIPRSEVFVNYSLKYQAGLSADRRSSDAEVLCCAAVLPIVAWAECTGSNRHQWRCEHLYIGTSVEGALAGLDVTRCKTVSRSSKESLGG